MESVSDCGQQWNQRDQRYEMPWEYLRDQAHRCMRLARTCPDQKTSHALGAMGMEFLDKARDLEKRDSIVPTETNQSD
jgi:hypothetical protein